MFIEPLFDKVIRISNEENSFESYLFEIPSSDDEEPSNYFLFYDFDKKIGITQVKDMDEFIEKLPQKRIKVFEKNSQGFKRFKIKMDLFLYNKKRSSFYYFKEVFKKKNYEENESPTFKLNLTIKPPVEDMEERKESY